METRKRIRERPALLGARDDVHVVDDRKARGEEWDGPAGVHEHVLHVQRSGERVAVVKLRDRPRGVDGVIQERVGETEGMCDRIGGRGG